jgi:hypothetical protein
MSSEPKVMLTTLCQRTSAAGNIYLSGFLGKARIVGFRGEPTEDGTPTWDLYLQNSDRDGQRQAPRSSTASTRLRSRRSTTPRDQQAGDDPNDDISDIGMAP